MTAHVITNQPGLLSRLYDVLCRISDNLDFARELRRRSPESARDLLVQRGLMTR